MVIPYSSPGEYKYHESLYAHWQQIIKKSSRTNPELTTQNSQANYIARPHPHSTQDVNSQQVAL